MVSTKRFTSVEGRIDAIAHSILDQLPQTGLAGALVEFLVFGLKQAWACLYGGLLLGAILLTSWYWPQDFFLARYDFLFLFALTLQIALLWFKLEMPSEAIVIGIFHLVGTGMELFKTQVGSWNYPEANWFRIGAVPLFSGFMYASVGSYIARTTRIMDMRYVGFPKSSHTLLLAIAIYINFFSHHYLPDIRWVLFAITVLLFWKTTVHYRVFRFRHRMPLLLGFLLVAHFIWFAENIGTWSKVWLYPNQQTAWNMVSWSKFGSWYLLMIISFVLVTIVHRPQTPEAKS